MTAVPGQPVRVLVVDDSDVARELLCHILGSDPGIDVVATAANGAQALEAVAAHRPTVITMDVVLPGMDGFAATRKIMETYPTPIVIVTASSSPQEVATTFRAMEAGALAVLSRPAGLGHPDSESSATELVETVKLMSEVKVLRRWPKRQKDAIERPGSVRAEAPRIEIVAMGASTGGPVVLQTILAGLPSDFPVPILIVQHIAPGFIQGFVEWLGSASGFPVELAADGVRLVPGCAYVAPDACHMGVTRGNRIALSRAPAENGLRPAVSHLFRSVAEAFRANSAAVLLTGMGRDGAVELKALKDLGAYTFAQDGNTSVVHGMPGEAIKLDAAGYILPPDRIASTLALLAPPGSSRAGARKEA